jgi:hypothetical protein
MGTISSVDFSGGELKSGDTINLTIAGLPAGVTAKVAADAPEFSTLSILGPGALGMLGCAWRQRRRTRAGKSAIA